jgi:hypothetical protein
MQRICQTCENTFEPTFHSQKNCADCKLKKTTYKQNEREERGLAKKPDASDYVSPHADTLAKHAAETLANIRQELPDKKLTMDDAMVIEGIAETMLGLGNSWTKKVTLGKDPTVQLLVGGHFVDAIGSAAVERVHQAPHLLLSTTFAAMYQKFLPMVIDWASKNKQYSSDDLIRDVREGVAGTYILKTKTAVATPPYPAEVSADEPGVQLPPPQRITRQRPCPYIDDAAQRFLDGN